MVEAADTARDYRPIADYAAIGDCHGAALVARDGDIDWCCLARFDADPIFCRLLDKGKGGFLSLSVADMSTASRGYVGDTNVLRTELHGPSGRVALTDFMPVGRRPGNGPHDYVRLNAPGWLVRSIEVLDGEAEIAVRIAPTVDFGKGRAPFIREGGRLSMANGPAIGSDLPLDLEPDGLSGSTRLKRGDRRFIAIGEGAEVADASLVAEMLAVTTAYWSEWIKYCRYDGPHAEMVRRSALVLKLMTYAPTGATAAALTSSLPEIVRGDKNWDYRFCWVRDASLMLIALGALGYSGEAGCFYEFLDSVAKEGPERLQVGYGLMMERAVPESEVAHLDGYRGSRPVRIGNEAFDQNQADLYGHVLEGALTYKLLGGRMTKEESGHYAALVDHLTHCWQKADKGIWEIRGPEQHFVHSKAMCYAAVDRGIRLFGARPEWTKLRARIFGSMLEKGRGWDHTHFRRSYGEDKLDGALLLLPMLDLPLSRDLLDRTLDAVMRENAADDLVFRHPPDDDREGAFLACSFWLVDALLAAGRGTEAHGVFDRLCGRANDVGLLAEEIDVKTGEFLGNFPQALSHLGLVLSAVNLMLYEKGGAAALAGAYADRARRAVGATLGWRAVLSALVKHPLGLKLLSSRRSVLDMRRYASSGGASHV